jgi:hypothetical protein
MRWCNAVTLQRIRADRQADIAALRLQYRDGAHVGLICRVRMSRQAQNVDAGRKCCEIRLRAERKAGELLQQTERAKGGRSASDLDYGNLSDDATGFDTPHARRVVQNAHRSRHQLPSIIAMAETGRCPVGRI